jgi:capsule polysaccharide export protein KpsC/LpsZ
VPPQQEGWWRERQELVGRLLGEKLPPELQDIVKQDFDAQPITMEEAKQYRKELMEERSSKLEAQNEKFEIDNFDLCEH